MTRNEFISRITGLVAEYIDDEELYDDNAQLVINPETQEASLMNGDEDIDDSMDQYDVMDLLQMGSVGKWSPDNDAVSELASEYFE